MSVYNYQQNVPILRVDDVSLFLGNSVTVRKMPLLESHGRIRSETDSERALSCLLERRRLNYQTRQKFLQHSYTSSSFSGESSRGSLSANNTGCLGDSDISFGDKSPSITVVKQPVLKPKLLERRKKRVVKSVAEKSKKVAPDKPPKKSSNLIEIDSRDLAERIVHQARQRMKEKHKNALNEAYLRPLRSSTPIPAANRSSYPKVIRVTAATVKHTANSGHADSQVVPNISSTDSKKDRRGENCRNESTVTHPVTKYLTIGKCNQPQ